MMANKGPAGHRGFWDPSSLPVPLQGPFLICGKSDPAKVAAGMLDAVFHVGTGDIGRFLF